MNTNESRLREIRFPRLVCDDKERELRESVEYEAWRLDRAREDYFAACRELNTYLAAHTPPVPKGRTPF